MCVAEVWPCSWSIIWLLIVKLAIISPRAENAKGFRKGSCDSAALVQPIACMANCCQPDDVCCMVTSLYFLVALSWDPRHFHFYSYFTKMPPKPQTTGKRGNGAANVPKRATRKVGKKAKVSVVTSQGLDSSLEALDNETMIDSDLDLASRMDMMMTMLVDLMNTVKGQEEKSVEQLDPPHPTPAKHRAEIRQPRWQNTSARIWIWRSQSRDASSSIWGSFHSLGAFTSQPDSSSDDEPVVKRT